MDPPKKRPRGLKKSLATKPTSSDDSNKRQKTTQEPATSIPEEPQSQSSSELRTIALDIENEEDDIGVLKGLFDTAFSKEDEGDLESSTDLFRGVIHECDKILRIYNGVIPSSSSETETKTETETTKPESPPPTAISTPLPPIFYNIYGTSLLHLGHLECKTSFSQTDGDTQEHDTLVDYITASIERFERGLELATESSESASILQLSVSIVKALFQKSTLLFENGDIETATTESQKAEKYLTHIKGSEPNVELSDLLDMAGSIQRYADVQSGWEERRKWNRVAEEVYNHVLGVEENNIDALVGLGSCYLSLGNWGLEHESEDGDETDIKSDREEEVKEFLENALAQFEKAHQEVDKTDTPHVGLLVLMGECLINLGNIHDSEYLDHGDDHDPEDEVEVPINEVADAYYKRAIECFRRVQKVDKDALPEEFVEFVEEWGRDMGVHK